MSTVATTNLKNASSVSNNIVLNSNGTTTISSPVITTATTTTANITTANVTTENTTTANITTANVTTENTTTANITTANITTANVTTLADSLGTNTSTPAAIAAGIAKAWVNFDGTSNSNNLSGTYSRTLTTVTVTATAHGLIAGNSVYLDFTSGAAVDGTFTVTTVIDVDNFEVTHGTSGSTSGNVTIRRNPIRASYNVSSITDNGTGDYTVNFTNAMPDANYAINVGGKRGTLNESLFGSQSSTAPATGSCRILLGQGSFTLIDGEFVNVSVFR